MAAIRRESFMVQKRILMFLGEITNHIIMAQLNVCMHIRFHREISLDKYHDLTNLFQLDFNFSFLSFASLCMDFVLSLFLCDGVVALFIYNEIERFDIA